MSAVIKKGMLKAMSISAILVTHVASVSARSSELIALDTTGARPTAELKIGAAAPVDVIFDTGAAGSVIFPEAARASDLPNLGRIMVGGHAGGTPREGHLSAIQSATLGGVRVANVKVAVVDLDLPLPGISGVMSPNIFAGKFVAFDLARSRVVVSVALPERAQLTRATDYSAPVHGQGLPQVEVKLPGKTVMAHLDTGSAYELILPLQMSRDVPLMGPLRPLRRPVRMAGSEHNGFEAEIAGHVAIGPLILQNPKTLFVERFPQANVGGPALRKLIIVLDPQQKRSWVLQAEE